MSRSPQQLRAWWLIAGSVAFFAVCALSLSHSRLIDFPSDSNMFRAVASAGVGSKAFWFGIRPWGFPLLMGLCRFDYLRLAELQFVLHLICWSAFAAALFVAGGRTRAATTSAFAVLAFACSPHLLSWSTVVLSESLTHSLLAAFLGLLLLFRRALCDGKTTPGLWAVGAPLVAVGILLAATRDNWPWFVLLAAVFLFLPPRRDGAAAARAAVAVVLAVACFFQIFSASAGYRWREGMVNVVMSRVMADPEVRERWRQRYGLPVDAQLISIAEDFRPGHQQALAQRGDFHRWILERSVGAYARDILLHPVDTAGRVLAGHRLTRDEFSWEYSEFQGEGTLIARAVRLLLFHRLWLPAGIDFLFPLAALAWLARHGRPESREPVKVLLLLAAYLPFLQALSFLSDSNEIYRHSLQVAIGLRLTGLLAVIYGVEAAFAAAARVRS